MIGLTSQDPVTSVRARRAAFRMSSIAASSRVIKGSRAVENRPASNPVVTAFHGTPADEIDFTSEDRRQLAGHLQVVEQAPLGVGLKGDQQIDVAVGCEILAQHRPEDLQPPDFPAAATGGQGLFVEAQVVQR